MAGKSALPLLAVGAGALLLMSSKKKKKSSAQTQTQTLEVPPTQPPTVQTQGSSGKSAGKTVWKERQTALAFVAGMTPCNCHPGAIDGIYGPATINAVIAFQICAGIGVDGKWGPQTDAAMKKMLADIAAGQVSIKKTSSESKGSVEGSDEDPYEKLSRYNLFGSILGYLPKSVYYVDISKMRLGRPGSRMFKFDLENGDRFAELQIYISGDLVEWDKLVTMLREIAIDAASRGVTIAFSLVDPSDFSKTDTVVLSLREKDKDGAKVVKNYKLSFDRGTISAKLPKAMEGWFFSVGGWLHGMNQTL